mgnify:CR=1 FL=1
MTDQGSAPDAAPVRDTSLALEQCLSGCDDEFDFEGLSLQDAELELCEQICHDSYGRDDDDDWSDDDGE